MNKYCKFLLLIFLFTTGNQLKLRSQVTWDTVAANNVTISLKPELLRVAVTVSSASSGSYFEVGMPNGFSYQGLVYQNTPAGNTLSYVGTTGNRVRFNVAGTPASGTVLRFWILQMPQCGALSTTSFKDTVYFFNGTSTVNSTSNLISSSRPDLSISAPSTSPSTATVGNIISRSMTINNGGIGATSRFVFVDKFYTGGLLPILSTFKINPSGTNYSIPSSRITINNDSIFIRFQPTDITNVGNGDTLFSNSESFQLVYQATVGNCGDNTNTITSSLFVGFYSSTSNTVCKYSSAVGTSVSITIPSAPNFSFSSSVTKSACYDGSTMMDTGVFINSGGAAKNFVVDLFTATYLADWNPSHEVEGYLDTATIRYKFGKNGTVIHPLIFPIANRNSLGHLNCPGYPISAISRIKFTLPIFPSGDTLYIYCGNKTLVGCGADCITGSGQNNIYYPSGEAMYVEYDNACGNVHYAPPSQYIIFPYNNHFTNENIMNRTTAYNIASNSNTTIGHTWISAGGYSGTSLQRLEVTLPPFLVLDSSYANPVWYEITAGTPVYPSSHSSAYAWEFTKPGVDQTRKLYIKVKALCAGAIPTGTYSYNLKLYVNPDTNSCSLFTRMICLNTEFIYQNSCNNPCDSGLRINNMTITRRTFGLNDLNNDGLYDGTGRDTTQYNLGVSAGGNSNYNYAGDTFTIMQQATVKTGLSGKWENMYMGFSQTGIIGGYIKYVRNSIKIKRGSTGLVTVTNLPTPLAPSNTSYLFDLSSLGNFEDGDSIWLWSDYTAVVDGSNSQSGLFSSIHYASHGSIAPQFSCGSYLAQHRIYGFDFFMISYSTATTGCGQVQQSMAFYNDDDWGYGGYGTIGDRFLNEYRPIAVPDRVDHIIPPGYVIDSIRLNYHSQYFSKSVSIPYIISGDTLKISNVRNLFVPFGGTIPVGDDAYSGDFRVYAKPTCKTPNGITPYKPLNYYAYNFLNNKLQKWGNPAYTGYWWGGGWESTYTPAQFVINSTQPVVNGYTSNVNWPLTITNVSNVSVNNTWVYLKSMSGNVVVDSLKQGSTLVLPDANGFFRLGSTGANVAQSFSVFAHHNACNNDSLSVFYGYACDGYPTAFTSTLCNFNPGKLTLLYQPSSIQTSVTPLSSTPSDPSNGSSAAYGSSSIPDICSEMPVELLINSGQTGTLYSVHELLNIPVNGGSPSLSFVSGSGYIEWPIGTTPRAFNSTANAALTTSGLTQLDFSLSQIDPTNFNTVDGLPGTGTAASGNDRQAILRFKLKSNCSFLNGDQWTVTQTAKSPCGAAAIGNGSTFGGYQVLVSGVSNPYNMTTTLSLSKDSIAGYNDSLKVTAVLQKIGSSSVGATDTIRIIVPNAELTTIKCFGARCPSATPNFIKTSGQGLPTIYKLVVPGTMGNADTLRFESWLKSNPLGHGCSDGTLLTFRTTEEATLYCSTTGTNCPGAQIILGQDTKEFDIDKPNLEITAISAELSTSGAWYTYNYNVTIANHGSANVPVNSNQTLELFFDANADGILDPSVDKLVGTATYNNALVINATDNISGTFVESSTPDPTRALWAVWRSSVVPNCNCDNILQSSPVLSLPINMISYRIKPIGCVNTVEWSVTDQSEVNYYLVQWNNGKNWKQLDKIENKNKNASAISNYNYVHSASEGKNYYRILSVNNQGKSKTHPTLMAHNMCLGTSNIIVQPNPAHNNVEYSVANGINCNEYTIGIVSLNGKDVYKSTFAKSSGNISLKGIAPGIYVLKISCDAFTESVKLIVE